MEIQSPDATSLVGRYRKRHSRLRSQLEQWKPQWQEINDNVLPRARFQPLNETNKGEKKFLAIINNAAPGAIRTATAGMVSGLTNPARVWKRTTTPDPDLAEFPRVRSWLHTVNERQLAVYAKSNVYQVLTAIYFDLLTFGVSCAFIDEDDETVMRGYHAPLGTYVLACSKRGRVDTAMRDLVPTVRQVMQQFDKERISRRVREMWDKGDYDEKVEVTHVIEPNEDYQPGKMLPQFKPFKSCWYEKNADDQDKPLRESGFSENRILAPRWMVLGDDTYGTTCPGMEMLGDAKAIQAYEKEKARLVELLGGPPTAVPFGLTGVSLQPRKIINLPLNAGKEQAYPIFQADPRAIQAIAEDIKTIARRINDTSYASLWLALTMNLGEGPQMTAEQARAIIEEKVVQIAPVLLRLNDELLDPLDDCSFSMMWRAGLIPEPPPELEGVQLKIEYVSQLHTAQQFVQLGGLERLAGFVMSIAKFQPDALLKSNIPEWIDQYAHTLGLPPNCVLDDDEYAKAKAAQAAQQQAVAMAQTAQVTADAAHKLGNTPVDSGTALQKAAELAGQQGPMAQA